MLCHDCARNGPILGCDSCALAATRAELVSAIDERLDVQVELARVKEEAASLERCLHEALGALNKERIERDALKAQLREANHRCGAAWRDLADARKRIDDLDKHVLIQRALAAAPGEGRDGT